VSIDGVVMCSCLDEGTALPPPCPVVADEGWVRPASGHDDQWRAVRDWAETACQHRQFWLVEGRVIRSALRAALDDHGGPVVYPALLSALPSLNGGSVSPRQAADCVAELDRLADLMRRVATMVVLVDDTDAAVVWVYDDECYAGSDEPIGFPDGPPGQPSIIGFDEGHRITTRPDPGRPSTVTWLGRDATVRVRDADTGTVKFAATEFTQHADRDGWMFHDKSTGTQVRHCSPIRGSDGEPGTGCRFHTETRPVDIDIYLPGVAFLRRLFATSARTDRTVYWH